MMMMGEARGAHAHVPPWLQLLNDTTSDYPHLPVSGIGDGEAVSPYLLAASRQYMPTTEEEEEAEAAAAAVDAYACDEFRMYEFKVRRCARGRSHDWTECPFAHPGEKARRRDPRKYHYSGTACPDFRKGGCKRGDSCEFAHGVFECWLHPARYRTQPCKDGTTCRRRVCFFAHTPEQLRVLPPQQQQQLASPRGSPTADSYDGSPLRRQPFESYLTQSLMSSSPTSTLVSPPKSPPSESPPLSPVGGGVFCRGSWKSGSPVNDVLESLRQLRLGKVGSAPCGGWSFPAAGFGSTMGAGYRGGGYVSLPTTPTRSIASQSGEVRDLGLIEEEPVERVESGRAIREKVFERLSKEATLAAGDVGSPAPAPDVNWVSDLVD